MAEPSPLIEISGPPRERGLQYGRAAASRIRRGIAHYAAQIRGLAADDRAVPDLLGALVPAIERFDPDLVPEMRGIAAGAGVSFEEILLLNARTEVLKLAARRVPAAAEPDGCTGVVALPATTRDGRLLHAQNWDWKLECAETTVVLHVRREDGPDILTFTEAGALARSGLNAAGIAITANFLESDREAPEIGVPLALIRRAALAQEHFALAVRCVYCTPKNLSNNMILSHEGGIAIDFECAPDECFTRPPERGLIVHANHWQSPVALGRLRERAIAVVPDSLYRDLRVRDLLERDLGALTLDHVKAALFDDLATPWSVCRPPRRNTASNLTATVAMVAMQPAEGVMEVAMLPALDRQFTRYALAPLARARRAAE